MIKFFLLKTKTDHERADGVIREDIVIYFVSSLMNAPKWCLRWDPKVHHLPHYPEPNKAEPILLRVVIFTLS